TDAKKNDYFRSKVMLFYCWRDLDSFYPPRCNNVNYQELFTFYQSQGLINEPAFVTEQYESQINAQNEQDENNNNNNNHPNDFDYDSDDLSVLSDDIFNNNPVNI